MRIRYEIFEVVRNNIKVGQRDSTQYLLEEVSFPSIHETKEEAEAQLRLSGDEYVNYTILPVYRLDQ